MPFENIQLKAEHWVKHGAEMTQKTNLITAAILKILIAQRNSPSWDADSYEWLGDYVLGNGMPHVRGGKFLFLNQGADGVLVTYGESAQGLGGRHRLRSLFHANDIEAKMWPLG